MEESSWNNIENIRKTKKKKPTAHGIPKRSPIQVLSMPNTT